MTAYVKCVQNQKLHSIHKKSKKGVDMLYKMQYGTQDTNQKEVFYVHMDNESLENVDIIKLLESKKKWHRNQILMINKMLEAASTTEEPQTLRKVNGAHIKIPWTSLIDEIFNEQNNLTLGDVRRAFVAMGYPEAGERKNSSTIYQTLKRKIKQGEFGKSDNGEYYKKQPEISNNTDKTGENLFRPSPE